MLYCTVHETFHVTTAWIEMAEFQYHIDGFFFGISDETARIDNCNFSLRIFGVMSHFVTVCFQLTHQFF